MSAPEQPAAPGPCPIPNCGWDAEGTLDDHLYEHDYNELRPTVVRLALETDQLRASRAASHQPQFVQPPADLRQRIAQAARTVRLRLGPNAIGMAQRGESIPLSGGEADELTDAVMAVVEPVLTKLQQRGDIWKDKAAELEQDRDRLDAELAALREQLAARPGCPDPIECGHEAATGQALAKLAAAEAENARLRALLAHDHAAAYHQGEPRDGLLWHCGRDHCTAPAAAPSA